MTHHDRPLALVPGVRESPLERHELAIRDRFRLPGRLYRLSARRLHDYVTWVFDSDLDTAEIVRTHRVKAGAGDGRQLAALLTLDGDWGGAADALAGETRTDDLLLRAHLLLRAGRPADAESLLDSAGPARARFRDWARTALLHD
jgi:hypothetical protein